MELRLPDVFSWFCGCRYVYWHNVIVLIFQGLHIRRRHMNRVLVVDFRRSGGVRFSLVLAAMLLLSAAFLVAQTTVSTGSVIGTVSDPQGALISGARVSIANLGTGQVMELATNSSGAYTSGALAPGTYRVQISSRGFKSSVISVNVQVGNTSTVNAQLEVG